MKTAFIFPGQGAQQVGMGRGLCQADSPTGQLYRRASEVVGYDLAAVCLDGPAERLDSTAVSQPGIFVTSVACLEAVRQGQAGGELGQVSPDAYAGLSLGEYTALYAAGAMSFEDGVSLVDIRGRSMQAAANEHPGAMVSLLGLDRDGAKKLCEAVLGEGIAESGGGEAVLVPVNFNCPGQIVISGTVEACKRAAQMAEGFGAGRAIPLRVAGAFHTKLMDSAAGALGQAIEKCSFSLPEAPLVANVNAQVYDGVDQIADKLLRQLVSPVLWEQSVEYLLDAGFERFVEIGPGRVLTGLVKKIARGRKQKVEIVTVNGLD